MWFGKIINIQCDLNKCLIITKFKEGAKIRTAQPCLSAFCFFPTRQRRPGAKLVYRMFLKELISTFIIIIPIYMYLQSALMTKPSPITFRWHDWPTEYSPRAAGRGCWLAEGGPLRAGCPCVAAHLFQHGRQGVWILCDYKLNYWGKNETKISVKSQFFLF